MLRPVDPSCSLFHPADDREQTNGISPDIEHGLTCRERQVLKLLAEGLDAKALANALHISHATARNHIQHIYAKLGIHNRAEAVSYIFRNGLMR
ncbi:MAG: LuxR C-terminal-related transcriptional regulator [Sulfuricaulis sp.]|uniref:response regulator transcription factor n=1 Tax=Sulfuricaulis sp. TaxID=2003553 RepID=UPI0025CF639B|nr:LuxR C-terminal-related transcriptional regulator [Sulfuricaulis sp.]MCR4346658.1 LuxR C-terminal-related transcriptional regulator [Sulfuricaulis sp.]